MNVFERAHYSGPDNGKTYQGHRNRETWVVWASISHNEQLLNQCLSIAKKGMAQNKIIAKISRPADLPARLAKTFPIVECGSVDWDGIAELLLEHLDGIE